jgi:hypothetical protein
VVAVLALVGGDDDGGIVGGALHALLHRALAVGAPVVAPACAYVYICIQLFYIVIYYYRQEIVALARNLKTIYQDIYMIISMHETYTNHQCLYTHFYLAQIKIGRSES